ncbi:serine-rich adhesin for platelets-like [Haliotis cracherodii]|uniref:serine-rich adhesin for platelets-like n=1 Tax=Haliotis cracherodii TaxID=6455 RepID=UPI0039E8FBAC
MCEDCEAMVAELYCPDCQGVGERAGVCLCLTCADKLHSGALKRNHGVKDVSAAPRTPKQYIPHPYRAPFAVLIGMYRGLLDMPPMLSMNEGEIKIQAQPFTDTDLQDKQTGRYVGGFDCMENTLMNKGLVQKEAADRHTFALTESGQRLGEQLYLFHTAVAKFMAGNNVPTVPVQHINSQCGTRRLYLVIDDKERDVQRLSKLARDHGIPTLIRSLPAGDYVWILSPPLPSPHTEYNGNNRSAETLLPFIVERKSWDDYYNSWRGSRFQRQVNNMKASGVENCFYLVEGSVKNLRFVSADLQQRLKDQLVPLMVEDGFCVNYTSSWSKSAQWLCWMTSLIAQAYKEGVFKKQMTFSDLQKNITESNRNPSVRPGIRRGKSHVWLSQDLIQCISSSTGNDSLKKTCEANFGPAAGSRDPCQLLIIEGLEMYNKQRSGLLIKCCESVANTPHDTLNDEVSLYLLPQKDKMLHYDVFSYWQLYIQVFFGVYVVRSEVTEDTGHMQAAFLQTPGRSGTLETNTSRVRSVSGHAGVGCAHQDLSLPVSLADTGVSSAGVSTGVSSAGVSTGVSLVRRDFAADLQTEEYMVQMAIAESMKESMTNNHGHKSNEPKMKLVATISPITLVDSQGTDHHRQTTQTKSGKMTNSALTSPDVIELVDSQDESVDVPKSRSVSLPVCGGSVCDPVVLDDSQEDDQIPSGPCANEGYQSSCVVLIDSQEESQLPVCDFLSEDRELQNSPDPCPLLQKHCSHSPDSITLPTKGSEFPCSKTFTDPSSVLQKNSHCHESITNLPQGSESLPDSFQNQTEPSPVLQKHCCHDIDRSKVDSITNLKKESTPLCSPNRTDQSSVSQPELDSTNSQNTFPTNTPPHVQSASNTNKEHIKSFTGNYPEQNKIDLPDSLFNLPPVSTKHCNAVAILSEEEQLKLALTWSLQEQDRDSQNVSITCMKQHSNMNANKVLTRQSDRTIDQRSVLHKTPTKRRYASGHGSPESKIPRFDLGERCDNAPGLVQSTNSSVGRTFSDTVSHRSINSDAASTQGQTSDKSDSAANISDAPDVLGIDNGAETLKDEELARRLQQEFDDEYSKSKVGNNETPRLLRSKLGSEPHPKKLVSCVADQRVGAKGSSETCATSFGVSSEEQLLNGRSEGKDVALSSLTGKQEVEEPSRLPSFGPSGDGVVSETVSSASDSAVRCSTSVPPTSANTSGTYDTDMCNDSNDHMSDSFREDIGLLSESGVSFGSDLHGHSSINLKEPESFLHAEGNSRTVSSHVDPDTRSPIGHETSSVSSEKIVPTDEDAIFSGEMERKECTETTESVSQDIVKPSVKDMSHTESSNSEVMETSDQCEGHEEKNMSDYSGKCVVPRDEGSRGTYSAQLVEDYGECASSEISQSVLPHLPKDPTYTHKAISVTHSEAKSLTHHSTHKLPENEIRTERTPMETSLDEVKTEAMTDEEFARQLQEQFDKESGIKRVPTAEAMSLRRKRLVDTKAVGWPLDCKVPKAAFGSCTSSDKEEMANREQRAYVRTPCSHGSAHTSNCDSHRLDPSAQTSISSASRSSFRAHISNLNSHDVRATQNNISKAKTSRKALFDHHQPSAGVVPGHDSYTVDTDAELARILQEEELQKNMAGGSGGSACVTSDAEYARSLLYEEQRTVSSEEDLFQMKQANVNPLVPVPERVCDGSVFGVGSSADRSETDVKFDRLPRKPIGRNKTEKFIANQLALYRELQRQKFCGVEDTGSHRSSRSTPGVTPSIYSRSPTTRRVPSATVTSPWQDPSATSPWQQPSATKISATARTPPKACVTPVRRVSVTHQTSSTFKSFGDKTSDGLSPSDVVPGLKTEDGNDVIDITEAGDEDKQAVESPSKSPVVKNVRCGNCKQLGHPRTHSGCPHYYKQSEVERREVKASENLKRRVERAKENEEALELLTRSEQILKVRKQTMLAQIRAEAEKVEEEFNDQIRQLNQVVKRREKRKKKTT